MTTTDNKGIADEIRFLTISEERDMHDYRYNQAITEAADIAAAGEAALRAEIEALRQVSRANAARYDKARDALREAVADRDRLAADLVVARECRLRLDRRIHNQRARLRQLETALGWQLRSYYQTHIARTLGWNPIKLLKVKSRARAALARISGGDQ